MKKSQYPLDRGTCIVLEALEPRRLYSFSSLPPADELGAIANDASYGSLTPPNPIAAATPNAGLIGLDRFRADSRFQGIDGGGYTVAVLDTGVDLDHPFFGPDADFNGIADRIIYQHDYADDDEDAGDIDGHGTSVTSIIGSQDPTLAGMAAGVNFAILKVFPDDINTDTANVAAIENALIWIINNASTYNIVSVNMSLGSGDNNAPQLGGYSDELETLVSMNILPVASAGNGYAENGSRSGVNYPAADPNVLAVGAVWDSDRGGPHTFDFAGGATDFSTGPDRIISFSQRSANIPMIFAPGGLIEGAGLNGGLSIFSGTSQAAPHIAGVAVLAQQLAMRELGRRLTFAEFRDLIRATGVTITDGDDEADNVEHTNQQFKRVDLFALAGGILALKGPGTGGGEETDPGKLSGTGDFNGDGNLDIIWRSYETGENTLWLMNGNQRLEAISLTAAPSLNWIIRGVGNFDGDGRNDDLIWWNRLDGRNRVWLMDGGVRQSVVFLRSSLDLNWKISGIGDFDNDGLDDDIVWRNRLNGMNRAWLMDATTFQSRVFLTAAPSLNWDIKGIGDFNGDGDPDLLWRNAATGRNRVWLMDGLTKTANIFLDNVDDQNWIPRSVGDMTGDGKADVLWQNASIGQQIVWEMNGTQKIGQELLQV